MKLVNYLPTLLPSFSRGRMLEDLAALKEELSDSTLPPLQSLAKTFGSRKFESAWVKEFDDIFKKNTKFKYSGNFYNGMTDVLEGVLKNCDVIESLINEYYASDVMRDAMTVIRVNLLQYLETMSFAILFARRVAVTSMSLEVAAVTKSAESDTEVVLPGEFEWLNSRRQHFFSALNTLSGDKAFVEKTFKEMPEMTVNPESVDNISAVNGNHKVDPFQFGLIPLILNPIYHVRMAIADWQVARYKAAEEEKRALEFKILKLKLSASGKNDANLDRQIEYCEGRLQKLNFKLKELEESYGTA